MDNYYRQTLAWSQQQAQERRQESVDLVRINAERQRLRLEHIERIRIYEAQLASIAVATAGGGGGGRKSDTSTNEFVVDYIDDYFE